MNTEALLFVEHLSKAYGAVQAVDDINLQLYPGELVALLGENGAGKTTTLQMIAGLLTPDQGTIRIAGKEVAGNAAKCLVGYMPEAPFLYPTLSGQEFLEFLGGLHGFPRRESHRRAQALLAQLNLQDVAHRRIRSYSQGMCRRLMLCAALLHQPRLLLLDEPLNGIDPLGIIQVKDMLSELSRQGRAILISTHLLDIAERICQRAIILSHGRIIADDTIDTLRQHMQENTLEQVFSRLMGVES